LVSRARLGINLDAIGQKCRPVNSISRYLRNGSRRSPLADTQLYRPPSPSEQGTAGWTASPATGYLEEHRLANNCLLEFCTPRMGMAEPRSQVTCTLRSICGVGIDIRHRSRAAGIVSSQIAKSSSSERLIIGPNCGFWSWTGDGKDITSIDSFMSKTLRDTNVASTYSRACYSEEADPLRCNTYSQPRLPYTVNQNGSCPFKSGTCFMGETAAYSMDTGLLDSLEHLGINTPPDRRV
jgi:hypothetical protein